MRVSLEQIYEELRRIASSVDRLADYRQHVERILEDQEKRIRALERRTWVHAAGAAVLGALGGTGSGFFSG